MSKEKERIERLKNIVLNLPELPGCYQYFNKNKEIIYVEKAKNLKRRVSSYFNKNQQSRKTEILVSKIEDINYVIVPTDEMFAAVFAAAQIHRFHAAGFRVRKQHLLPCFCRNFSAAGFGGKLSRRCFMQGVAAVFQKPAGKFFVHF